MPPWSLCIVLMLARRCTDFPTPSSLVLENHPSLHPPVPHLPALKGKEKLWVPGAPTPSLASCGGIIAFEL